MLVLLPLELLGAKETHTCYFYKLSGRKFTGQPGQSLMEHELPAFQELDAKDCLCDLVYKNAVETATSGLQARRTTMELAARHALLNVPPVRGSKAIKEIGDATAHRERQKAIFIGHEESSEVILLLNFTRANKLGKIRAENVATRTGARVITVKVCSSLPERDRDGNLVHICGDFKTLDGVKTIMQTLEHSKLPPPVAVILDYIEPFKYGVK